MNRENIRTPARSISNLEFHHTTDETNEVARRIVSALEKVGIGAINGGAVGFPMEADRWGSKMWVISHKRLPVEQNGSERFPRQNEEAGCRKGSRSGAASF